MLTRLAWRGFARKVSLSASKTGKPPSQAPPQPPATDPSKSRLSAALGARQTHVMDEFPKELKQAGISRKDVDPEFLSYVPLT